MLKRSPTPEVSRYFAIPSSLAACLALAGCAADISSLVNDPATLTIHQVVQAPVWSITTDVTRVNSTNTAASASAAGTTVNVPLGSVVNPGQAKIGAPAGTSTLTTSPALGTTIPAPGSTTP